jgi:hypothetical protein
MNAAQVHALTDRINDWWRGKVGITEGLRTNIWQAALVSIPADVGMEAVRRYAEEQHTTYPPSVKDILRWSEDITDERHRAQIRMRQAEDKGIEADAWQKAYAARELRASQVHAADTLGVALANAAHDPWARGHVEMFDLGVARPGREAEAAEFCRKKAADEGPDAADWSKEAVWYQRMAAQTGMIIPQPHNDRPSTRRA